MKKSTLIPAILFIILAGGLFFVLTNAHIAIFSGREHINDYFTQTSAWKDKDVSLLAVSRGDGELNMTGWLTAGAVIGGFPLLVSMLVRRRIRRKEMKKEEIGG